MALKAFAIIAFALLLGGCTPVNNPNKFSDPVLIRIGDYQDKRQSDSLYQFLDSEKPVYRAEAALAFGSVQDTTASQRLGNLLLEDKDPQVRSSAAFALGQTGGVGAVNALIPAVNDPDRSVVREVMEALGKSVSRQDLSVLENYRPDDSLGQEGLAWGLYRLGVRGIVDSVIVLREIDFLNARYNYQTRLAAAHFFSRAPVPGVVFENNLIEAALHDPAPDIRMAAVSGLKRFKDDKALSVLEEVLNTEADYRVRVNAVRALQVFPFAKTKVLLSKVLAETRPEVSIAASEIIKAVLKIADPTLVQWARSAKNSRVQANLYEALLAVEPSPERVNEVKKKYRDAENDYQKAALLGSLSRSTGSYGFIFDELMRSKVFVIQSSAAQALTDIHRAKGFPAGLKREFAGLYKQAVIKGDPAVIGIISAALSDPVLGCKEVIKDFTFLYEAKAKLQLPQNIESLQPLEEAIAYFEGKEKPGPLKSSFNHPVDWKGVMALPANQRVLIRTVRGDLVLRLFLEEAPGSVANFVDLIQQKYFDGKYFHRVVPNFVIQAGCNRGDGFGSENFSIRSEFSRRRYRTGSVGMASAGKDTEGTQWFITHSPTPHLDGRYTIFAEVEKGMEVVREIEVGDAIVAMTLIKN